MHKHNEYSVEATKTRHDYPIGSWDWVHVNWSFLKSPKTKIFVRNVLIWTLLGGINVNNVIDICCGMT